MEFYEYMKLYVLVLNTILYILSIALFNQIRTFQMLEVPSAFEKQLNC